MQEGKVEFKASTGKISKKLEVFYNPVMKLNRDISILLLKALGMEDIQIALPLAGSGVRGLRILKELPESMIKCVYFNDQKEDFIELMKENLENNNIKDRFEISNQDANLFLMNGNGYDYIDIDPFGTPNPFFDSAIKRISRRGILAVTATDTSALCGTYENACKRKYWAKPLRNYLMHEIGLRILIRKVQLIGSQYDKALIPIISYSKDHYMRVFFSVQKTKTDVDNIIKQHGIFENVGPMWLGQLWDEKILEKMLKIEKSTFLEQLYEEAKVGGVGFIDVHKDYPTKKFSELTKDFEKKGKKVSRTHFLDTGLRVN